MGVSSEIRLIDAASWIRTGQPGHGLINIPASSASEEEDPEKANRNENVDERNRVEKLLFYFAREGSVEGIREVLQRHPPEQFNVNVKNEDGCNLLMTAVGATKHNLEVVKVVLEEVATKTSFLETHEGLMKAVRRNKVEVVQEILRFEERRKGGGTEEYKPQGDWSSEVTPLMIAASRGNYQMIKLLYESGERMPLLHYSSCKCRVCRSFGKTGERGDLDRIRRRIALLEGTSSLEWLLFMSGQDSRWDPLWEGIRMIGRIKRCIREEVEWLQEYDRVLQKVERVPGIMVALCRTSQEIQVLLGGGVIGQRALFQMAVNRKVKRFLAEEKVWFILREKFSIAEGGGGSMASGSWERMGVVLLLILFFPIVNIILAIASCFRGCAIGGGVIWRVLGSPESRFWMKFASYKGFLGILVILTFYEGQKDERKDLVMIKWLRLSTIIYVCSHSALLFRGFYQNPKYFFNPPFNKVNLLACLLFWTTFAIWFVQDVLSWKKLIQEDPGLQDVSSHPLICRSHMVTLSLAVSLSILYLFRFTILIPPLGRVQSRLANLVEGKWEVILIYTLLATIIFFLIGFQVIRNGPWQYSSFLAVLVVNGALILFLQITGTGVFSSSGCGGERTMEDMEEWRYRQAVEWWHYIQEDQGLTPPFSLIPCCETSPAEEEEEEGKAREWRRQYPYLWRTLSQRYFRQNRDYSREF